MLLILRQRFTMATTISISTGPMDSLIRKQRNANTRRDSRGSKRWSSWETAKKKAGKIAMIPANLRMETAVLLLIKKANHRSSMEVYSHLRNQSKTNPWSSLFPRVALWKLGSSTVSMEEWGFRPTFCWKRTITATTTTITQTKTTAILNHRPMISLKHHNLHGL